MPHMLGLLGPCKMHAAPYNVLTTFSNLLLSLPSITNFIYHPYLILHSTSPSPFFGVWSTTLPLLHLALRTSHLLGIHPELNARLSPFTVLGPQPSVTQLNTTGIVIIGFCLVLPYHLLTTYCPALQLVALDRVWAQSPAHLRRLPISILLGIKDTDAIFSAPVLISMPPMIW